MTQTIQGQGFDGAVTFDGEIVVIRWKGWRGRETGGQRCSRLPVGLITKVVFRPAPPGGLGTIRFVSLRESARAGGGFHWPLAIRRSEDTDVISFRPEQEAQFAELRDAIAAHLAADTGAA